VEAATAKVCAVVFPLAFIGFYSLRYLSPSGRWLLITLFLALAVPLSILIASSDLSHNADQKILRALNKDATLTGRTLMWTKADQWINKSPAIGHGYRAFWTSGSSDSMGLLHFNRIIDARGFQLHNTIKEIRVDTGWIGLIAFLSVVVFFLYRVLAMVFLYPSPASAFLATMYLMTLSLGSINTIVGVFTPSTALFYMCGTAAVVFFMNRSAAADAQPQREHDLSVATADWGQQRSMVNPSG
jgi:exopolysaccharide production protein ExoQ